MQYDHKISEEEKKLEDTYKHLQKRAFREARDSDGYVNSSENEMFQPKIISFPNTGTINSIDNGQNLRESPPKMSDTYPMNGSIVTMGNNTQNEMNFNYTEN